MRRLFREIEKVAGSDATVLISGESGTGKELVARAIHSGSPRRDRAFVAVNASALPESLAEAELFGHEKGAFTGAIASRPGRFELAQGGTLFLDEIGTLSLAVQSKLLRALESREIERVGGRRTIPVDFRLISATNENLEARVAAGTFREDLFYRIHTVPIVIPPLRERVDDIPLLVDHFLARFCARHGKPAKRLSAGVLERLRHIPGGATFGSCSMPPRCWFSSPTPRRSGRRICPGRCANRPPARAGRPSAPKDFAGGGRGVRAPAPGRRHRGIQRRQGRGGETAWPGREPDQVPLPKVRAD